MSTELTSRLQAFEGYNRYAYECSAGKITIGYGTMIEPGGYGIPEDVATLLLEQAIADTRKSLSAHLWFRDLNEARQECLIEMAYQMGVFGVLGFSRMIEALTLEDWEQAAREALDSLWAQQTPDRAIDVANRLAAG